MDDQQNQAAMPQPAMDQAAPAQVADMPAMPSTSTPPMPTTDMGGMPTGFPTTPTAVPSMDAMAAGYANPTGAAPAPEVPVATTPDMPMVTPAASTGPATMDEIMAELRKIEDKLVEMDEKL